MTLPVELATRDVTISYVDLVGDAVTGHVVFTLQTPIVMATGLTILPRTIRVELIAGAITKTLPVNNDADAASSAFTWQIEEFLIKGDGTPWRRKAWAFSLPTGSSTLNLGLLAPAPPSTGLLTLKGPQGDIGPEGLPGPTGGASGPQQRAPQARVDKMIYNGTSTDIGMVTLGGTTTIHDTSDMAIGTEHVKFISPVSLGVPSGVGVFSGAALPDLTGYEICLWLKVTGMTNTVDFKFWIGESGLSKAYSWNLSEAGTQYPFLRGDGWYRITLPHGARNIEGSAPDLTLLNSWILRAYDNGVAPITVQLGGIGYVKRQTKYPNGLVTIRFDDLYKSQIQTAAPYMARYGFRATSYVIAETLFDNASYPSYATLEDAHKLEDTFGWEHASHAYNVAVHNQTVNQGGTGTLGHTAYTAAVQLNDMQKCRDYLQEQGFRAPDHFAYPQGAWDATARHSTTQAFNSAVTLAHAHNESVPVVDPYRIRCYAPPSSVTGAQLTAEVDKAIAGKEWLIILFHNIVTTPAFSQDTSTAAFQTLMDYLNTEGVPVRLVSEVLKEVSAE